MTNEEYGITAIKLIFTIIILAVIISGIVFIVKKLWQDTSVKDIGTDLLYIKAKCKIIHDKNIIDKNEKLLGENIKEYNENEKINEIVSQSDKWYRLSQQDLETIGLGDLKTEDGYLVNYEEEDVIYAKGIQENGQIYYKLSELETQRQEKDKKEEEKQEEDKQEEQQETEEQKPTEEEKQPDSENKEEQTVE